MDQAYQESPGRLAESLRAIAARGVRPPAAALNPEAGHHAIPDDVQEIQAALRAGARSWQRFPYYAWRYGERGAAFTRSDSAWIARLAHQPQAVVADRVRWLGILLASRGMPQWLFQVHLEFLYEELVADVPERAALYERLRGAARMVHERRRQHIDDDQFAALARQFEARVDPMWTAKLPEAGHLLVAAVADEREGIERAVPSLVEWLIDPARFPKDWNAAADWVIREARLRGEHA